MKSIKIKRPENIINFIDYYTAMDEVCKCCINSGDDCDVETCSDCIKTNAEQVIFKFFKKKEKKND